MSDDADKTTEPAPRFDPVSGRRIGSPFSEEIMRRIEAFALDILQAELKRQLDAINDAADRPSSSKE